MKKFMLLLIATFMLVCWGWQGNLDFGTAPSYGQPPPPPGYYCDPYYQDCTYDNYYTAPYADPLSQFFYYSVPFVGGEIEERREHEGEEHRGYEHRGYERGGHEHGGFEHGHH